MKGRNPTKEQTIFKMRINKKQELEKKHLLVERNNSRTFS